MTKPKVFISYSHLDEPWKERFIKHLGIAEKQGLLQTWDDRQLRGGDDWFNEIVNAIESGSVAVLLVAPGPLSVALMTSEVLLNVPAAEVSTVTLNEHVVGTGVPAASVPLLKLIVLGAVVLKLPPQIAVGPLVATVKPLTSVSVN